MTDIDPRDFMDFYLVRVSPTVFSETSLTEDDFDADKHDYIYSSHVDDDELHIEFTTEQGAEKVLGEWNSEIDTIRGGNLIIRSPYSNDSPEIDGVLMFAPRT